MSIPFDCLGFAIYDILKRTRAISCACIVCVSAIETHVSNACLPPVAQFIMAIFTVNYYVGIVEIFVVVVVIVVLNTRSPIQIKRT